MKIITNNPEALSSPDYIMPTGAVKNNHSNVVYIKELHRIMNNNKFSYLDLGCAGGQSVVDIYNLGYVSCGIEGSDLKAMLDNTNQQNIVHENWNKYKDVCLFKGDITKPFELINDDNEIQIFNIITAWDVLEHPKPEEIPDIIDNIIKHMNVNSVFLCLINTIPTPHHQCIKPKDWWIKTFEDKGLIDVGFDIDASPRHTANPLGPDDFVFKFKMKNI